MMSPFSRHPREPYAPPSTPESPMPETRKSYDEPTKAQISQPSDPILQFFTWEHLPPHLQEVSLMFHNLAYHLIALTPPNAERAVALRKLLEAKDAAVRARLFK